MRLPRWIWAIFLLALLVFGGLFFFQKRPPAPEKPLPAAVQVPPALPDLILVDDFETGTTQGLFEQRKNRLDAFQGTFAKRPSYTVITKVADARPGRRGNALRLEYSKVGGWCGWYTLLNGIDVSRFNALTFWVKGEQGGERFDIGLADERMQRLEIDAVYVGPVTAFLPEEEVTTDWQQVKVPLAGLRSDLDLTRMGSLVLTFRYEGAGAIQIDDVLFVFDEEVERIQKENRPRAAADAQAPRASWVWKYDPVSSLEIRRELFEFCQGAALQTLYIYLGESAIPETPAEYQMHLAEFLKEAHEHGLEVHALQGNPLWALKAYHPLVLKWVGGFLEFNSDRPPAERIDGVHLDIEPYLTSEWETGDREQLKSEFLDLMRQLREMIGSGKGESPFQLGVAIPVFYDREADFEKELLGFADYAALMDYYDTSTDILQQGRFHVDLANRLGKRMVIGVETQDLVRMGQGKRRNTFHEEGWEEMERHLAQVAEGFSKEPSFAGLAIHAYDSYRLLQKGRNVPTRERSKDLPAMTASAPTQPIVVDGDLADWASVTWTGVNQRSQVVYGTGAWMGASDVSFKAASQWTPEALFLGIEVTDDVLVQEWRRGGMWEGDHVEVWIDSDLYGDYSEAVNSSDDFQWGLSPGNFGELGPEVHAWVPSIDPASLQEVQIAAQRRPSGYTLEIRLPARVLFQALSKRAATGPPVLTKALKQIPPEQIVLQEEVLASGIFKPGFRLGLMVDGSDTDHTRSPQKCLLSTSPERQWGDPTTFNILELK